MMKLYLKKRDRKVWILFFQICLFTILILQDCSARILNEKGKVLKEVVEIFRHYKPVIEEGADDIVQKRGLSKEKIDSILNPKTKVSDISLSDLNAIAQVVFLRPPQVERKDISPLNKIYFPYTNRKVFTLFRAIGDVGPVNPKKKYYRYIFLNGSTVKNMRERLKTLVDLIKARKLLIKSGTEIVFLTGERDLFPEENLGQLMNPSPLKVDPSWKMPSIIPNTEDQAAQWIWNQSLLPCSLRRAHIIFVRAKKKSEMDPKTKEIKMIRPTTLDTVQTWIQEEKPEPGACLSISSQPYVYYQEATIAGAFQKAGLLEKGFSLEGAGCGEAKQTLKHFKENIAVILDNFARTIYTETVNMKDSKNLDTHQGS